MTRIRHYGTDTPFGAWLRKQPTLPSNGVDFGLTATDVDMVVRCWKKRPTGQLLECILLIEVKTRGGQSGYGQRSIFESLHSFHGQKNNKDKSIRFYGVATLTMELTDPEDSAWMKWSRYKWNQHGNVDSLVPVVDFITADQLRGILRFDLHPSSLRKFAPHVTHHGSTEIVVTESSPLGFEYDRVIRKQF